MSWQLSAASSPPSSVSGGSPRARELEDVIQHSRCGHRDPCPWARDHDRVVAIARGGDGELVVRAGERRERAAGMDANQAYAHAGRADGGAIAQDRIVLSRLAHASMPLWIELLDPRDELRGEDLSKGLGNERFHVDLIELPLEPEQAP